MRPPVAIQLGSRRRRDDGPWLLLHLRLAKSGERGAALHFRAARQMGRGSGDRPGHVSRSTVPVGRNRTLRLLFRRRRQGRASRGDCHWLQRDTHDRRLQRWRQSRERPHPQDRRRGANGESCGVGWPAVAPASPSTKVVHTIDSSAAGEPSDLFGVVCACRSKRSTAPPNSRSTMCYQLSAFVDEVRACEALPADQRAKPWTYSLQPSPVRISLSECPA